MRRVFFIGYMGAGKTTLGKACARFMNLQFVDLDWYIEGRLHKTIQEIFAEKGEQGFREVEKMMLHEVGGFENVLIATGGGTPCYSDNMDYMNAVGNTVFLDVDVGILFKRLVIAKSKRPLLAGKTDDELKKLIVSALQQRMPSYRKAKYVFKANELDNREQIDEAVKRMNALLTDL